MSPEMIELIKSLGTFGVLVVMVAMYIRDKGRAESKTDVSLANIATSQTVQVAEIYKDMGSLRQDLGKSEGKVEVLQDTLKTERSQWNIERKELMNRINKLERKQAELIHESNSKSEVIANLRKERDAIKLELLHANNALESANAQIAVLAAKLLSANGVTPSESAITVDRQAHSTSASNLTLPSGQTAKTADNLIEDKEDNE